MSTRTVTIVVLDITRQAGVNVYSRTGYHNPPSARMVFSLARLSRRTETMNIGELEKIQDSSRFQTQN